MFWPTMKFNLTSKRRGNRNSKYAIIYINDFPRNIVLIGFVNSNCHKIPVLFFDPKLLIA